MTAALVIIALGLSLLACLHLWARACAAELRVELEREKAQSARTEARHAEAELRQAVRDHGDALAKVHREAIRLLAAAEDRAKEERTDLTTTLKELVIGPSGEIVVPKLHVSEDDEIRAAREAALASAEEADRRIMQAEAAMDAGLPVVKVP